MSWHHERLKVLSHRGRGFGEKDNSLAAIKKSLKAPIDGIEIDVQHSKDKKLVLWHDPWYKNSDAKKRHFILRTPYNKVNDLAHLHEALDLYNKYGVKKKKELHVDIKKPGQEELVVREIKKADLEHDVIVTSWVGKTLRKVKKASQDIKVGYSFAPQIKTCVGVPVWCALRLPRFIRTRKVPLTAINIRPFLFPATAWHMYQLKKFTNEINTVNADSIIANTNFHLMGATGSITNEPMKLIDHYGTKE